MKHISKILKQMSTGCSASSGLKLS